MLFMSRADDLIPEESDAVLLALKRLPPKEAYDRVFRLRRAFQVGHGKDMRKEDRSSSDILQCSLSHQLLPKDQHTKPQDVIYLDARSRKHADSLLRISST